MITADNFDEVFDCQIIFRHMVHSISNPGDITDFSEIVSRIKEEEGALLTLAMTLLDNETSFTLVGDEKLTNRITEMTYAKQVKIQNADFIFISSEIKYEAAEIIMSEAKPGTLVEPDSNAVIIVKIPSFEGEKNCTLKGPGIKGIKKIYLPEYSKIWLTLRDKMTFEYPTGIDIYYLTQNGELMAIPRKIMMEG